MADKFNVTLNNKPNRAINESAFGFEAKLEGATRNFLSTVN